MAVDKRLASPTKLVAGKSKPKPTGMVSRSKPQSVKSWSLEPPKLAVPHKGVRLGEWTSSPRLA